MESVKSKLRSVRVTIHIGAAKVRGKNRLELTTFNIEDDQTNEIIS